MNRLGILIDITHGTEAVHMGAGSVVGATAIGEASGRLAPKPAMVRAAHALKVAQMSQMSQMSGNRRVRKVTPPTNITNL